MNKISNKSIKKNEYNKNKSNKKNKNIGGDLTQKYSLSSIDEGSELGGFKHSNSILGILGVSSLLYYIYYGKQNYYT
jgi:hypothetical protein